MKDEFKELQEDVMAEQRLIEKVVQNLDEIKSQLSHTLVDGDIKTEPAIGTYLMNFYSGVENMVKRVCKVYYKTVPLGKDWHKKLLDLSYEPPKGKIAIFNQQIVGRLYKYKNFRHRFVSGYGFQLKVDKMLDLMDSVSPLWEDLKKQFEEFFEKLQDS